MEIRPRREIRSREIRSCENAPRARGATDAERLRRRLLVEGSGRLSDEELLALVAGCPTPTIRLLCSRFGDVDRLGHRSPRELTAVEGVGRAAAVRLAAALELGRRAAEPQPRGEALRESSEVYERFRGLALRERESFWALALDARHRVLRVVRVCEGGLTRCALRPSDVLTPLLREAAASAIVLHNHPSGDPEPSAQDVELTRRLAAAAALVGITLLDHVIVAAEGYVSLRDRGWPSLDDAAAAAAACADRGRRLEPSRGPA